MLFWLELGREVSPILCPNRKAVGPLGASSPGGDLPAIRNAGPANDWAYFLLAGGDPESRGKADLCHRIQGAWPTGSIRYEISAVCAAPGRDVRDRCHLFNRWQLGRLHYVSGAHVVAKPERRIGTYATDLSSDASMGTVHFPGRDENCL